MAGAKVLGAPVQNEWKGWVWKNFIIAVAGSEWHLPFRAMAGGRTGSSQRNSVFLQRCFLTAAQPVLCVLPINKHVGQQHSSPGALAHRLCRHLTSASLLRLYLVSASWGPMEHFWRSPDCYCALVWGGGAPTCKGWSPLHCRAGHWHAAALFPHIQQKGQTNTKSMR